MTNQKETNEEHYRRALADAMSELTRRDQTISMLNAKINELHAVSAAEDSTTRLLKKLYNKIDNKIMNNINSHGLREKTSTKIHPKIDVSEKLSLKEKSLIARDYDIEEFFTYRSKKQPHALKLHYRVVAKVYRSLRDGTVTVIKRTNDRVRG